MITSVSSYTTSSLYMNATGGGYTNSEKTTPSVEELAAKLFEENDTDGDSLLSIEESGMSSDMMTQLDTDGDGYASVSELEADMETRFTLGPPPAPPPMVSSMSDETESELTAAEEIASSLIEEFDTDSDELLSFEESGLTEDIWKTLDADEDGYASLEELTDYLTAQERNQASSMGSMMMPPPPPPPSNESSAEEVAASLIEELDTDGDELISLEESGLTEDTWETLDTDEDGYASIEEMTTYVSSLEESQTEENQAFLQDELMMPPPPPPMESGSSSTGLTDAQTMTQTYQSIQAMSFSDYSQRGDNQNLSNLFA